MEEDLFKHGLKASDQPKPEVKTIDVDKAFSKLGKILIPLGIFVLGFVLGYIIG